MWLNTVLWLVRTPRCGATNWSMAVSQTLPLVRNRVWPRETNICTAFFQVCKSKNSVIQSNSRRIWILLSDWLKRLSLVTRSCKNLNTVCMLQCYSCAQTQLLYTSCSYNIFDTSVQIFTYHSMKMLAQSNVLFIGPTKTNPGLHSYLAIYSSNKEVVCCIRFIAYCSIFKL